MDLSSIKFPKIRFDVDELNKKKGARARAGYLWDLFRDGETLSQARWEYLRTLTISALRVGRVVAPNPIVKKYLRTATTLMDVVDLGVSLQNTFIPEGVDNSHPNDKYALILGEKSGEYVETRIADKTRTDVFLNLGTKGLAELGVRKLKSMPSDEKYPELEDHLYEVFSTCTTDVLELAEPFRFLLKSRYQATDFFDKKVMYTFAYPMANFVPESDSEDARCVWAGGYLETYLLPTGFVKSCDFSKNYLKLDVNSKSFIELRPLKETETEFPIGSKVVDDLERCARKVLESGGKWGSAFIGDAGVGKTETVKGLVQRLEGYPLVWVTPSVLGNAESIKRAFSYIRSIPKVIVMMDDMDSTEAMASKTSEVSTLIDCMADKDSNYLLLATINDPSRIDSTLLDRAKRFDEVNNVARPKGQIMLDIVNYYVGEHKLEGVDVDRVVKELEAIECTHVQVSSVFARACNYAEGVVGTDDLLEASVKIAEFSKNAYKTRTNGKLVDAGSKYN